MGCYCMVLIKVSKLVDVFDSFLDVKVGVLMRIVQIMGRYSWSVNMVLPLNVQRIMGEAICSSFPNIKV